MKKAEFIKKFSKIEDTFEDEFRAEFNSPELIWEALKKQLTLTDVSQQRELLLAYNEEVNKYIDGSQGQADESNVDDFLANNCG
jgi:hypothetical protein